MKSTTVSVTTDYHPSNLSYLKLTSLVRRARMIQRVPGVSLWMQATIRRLTFGITIEKQSGNSIEFNLMGPTLFTLRYNVFAEYCSDATTLCGYKPVRALTVTSVFRSVDYGCRSRKNRRIIGSTLTVIYK